jgi:hypothetical protein
MTVANFNYFAEGGQLKSGTFELRYYDIAERNHIRAAHIVNELHKDADPRFGSAFEQGARSLGIFTKSDPRLGITPSTVRDVLTGECMSKLSAVQMASSPSGGGTIVSPGAPVGQSTPASRLFFPEVVMNIMEAALTSDYSREARALQAMLASDETISSEVFTQPLIDRRGPDEVRSTPIAQNALPRNMVSITASQTSKAIGTTSVGLQISEQAQGATTLDLVGIILTQQAEGELKARLWEDLASIVAGNKDAGQAAMTPVAGTAFDSGFTGGAVTQAGWIKMLNDPSRKVQYDSIICTLDDVLAIMGRSNRPLVFDPRTAVPNVGDLGSYGLNNEPTILNFEQYAPNVMIVSDGLWAADHMLVFDSRYFLRRVTNATASYSAVEKMVLQRSDFFRFDSGSMLYRLMEEAGMVVDYS